ncbi:threonine--tRNA ligase [Prauserella rugosa]|uniref:Threonine--tRNA ligase n=1 Tax=Prauserella rugosa TaxID=43354 RepID=A0A660CFM8_9PSEU|nr:threonine--tRNA ligase [Prauserella rugosa]KID30072.1 threonyl-tRNA synthetase [Prauserella sp. Am3]TWH19771.1 threonyl-tRNA synthetase [Prauserella rugosa]
MSQPSFVAAETTGRVVVPAGTTAGAAVREAGLPSKGPDAIVVVRDAEGQLRDLAWAPEVDVEVEPVAADTEDGRSVIRHSAAHVLAQAVQQQFPEAKLGIGPPVKDGFYYDFAVDTPFTPEDLQALEKRMKQIIKGAQQFSRRRVDSIEAAKEELADEPFKLELVDLKSGDDSGDTVDTSEVMEVGGGELTIYDNLDPRSKERVWGDLCRGPHVPTTKYIPAFKLTRTAAAYWRGDQANQQLQRIYGTAWESQEKLDEYIERLAEAERRDHRKLGAELDLFSFPDEIGSGLPVFHPKGGIIKREMEDYVRQRHIDEGFEYVGTPHISHEQLFHTSGHLPYYADTMFPPMEFDGYQYRLKAMNCPMHNLIYRSRGRSYRELPLRLFEFGHVYRYEKSGVIQGLTRVRGFAQDDSHSYCTKEQAPDEVKHLLHFMLSVLRDFGMDDFYLEMSTRDESKPDKFAGSDADWAEATAVLEQVAHDTGLELVADPGGAAFYGPKISVQAKDAIGRTWQMGTVQYDFNQPEGFELEYQAADGERKRPIMIHSAKFGSIERFFGVLTEHYAGAFPAWLAPVQVVGIPIAGEHVEHLRGVEKALRAKGIRVEVDTSDDRMQKKIRTHTTQKVPFLLLAGGKDVEAGAVSFRFRDGTQINGVPTDRAVQVIADWVARRENTSPTAEAVEVHVGQ